MEVNEYDFYEGVLTITVATQRPEAAPSSVLVAASMHEEYAAQCRSLLREYKDGLAALLPHYGIRKMQPAGSVREIDRDFNQDILRLHFGVGIALLASAWTADEKIVFAFERNIEKAVRDLFAANGVPNLFIPGEEGVMGETYIDIIFSLGAATNIGVWNVAA